MRYVIYDLVFLQYLSNDGNFIDGVVNAMLFENEELAWIRALEDNDNYLTVIKITI